MHSIRRYHERTAAAALILLATGCATTDRGNFHVYSPDEVRPDKEVVHYPVDPDYAEWIARICETGSFSYRDKDREFTPYGVVLKAIECSPRRAEDSEQTQRSPQTFQFRMPNEVYETLPEEVCVRFQHVPLSAEELEQVVQSYDRSRLG